jgi:hypothetical protein
MGDGKEGILGPRRQAGIWLGGGSGGRGRPSSESTREMPKFRAPRLASAHMETPTQSSCPGQQKHGRLGGPQGYNTPQRCLPFTPQGPLCLVCDGEAGKDKHHLRGNHPPDNPSQKNSLFQSISDLLFTLQTLYLSTYSMVATALYTIVTIIIGIIFLARVSLGSPGWS